MQSVAYIRVSTEEQVYGTSLESQYKACVKYAAEQGLVLPKANIFREEGESAKFLERTQLQNMLEFCKKNKGKIDYCIVWKVDRLARKSEYHHAIRAILFKYGIKLRSVTEPIGDDPMGNLMEGILASFAQFDNDIRTARTTSGMRARTQQGGWPHAAPYGYIKTRMPSGASSIMPDDTTAPIMKELLERFSTGAYTIKQTKDLAEEMGVLTRGGKTYVLQSIINLIQNPLYAGFVSSTYTNGEYVKGLHTALITPTTHYKIKAIISGKYKKNSRQAEESWPLRGGFIKCGYCNHPLTGSAPKGRSKSYPKYACMRCRVSPDKLSVSSSRDDVHQAFKELLKEIKPSPKVAELFKQAVLKRWQNEYKEALEYAQRIDGELSALKAKKSRVIDLYIDNKLDDKQKTAKLSALDDEIADFELKKTSATEEVADKEQVVDAALMLLARSDEFWNLGSLQVRKQLQDLIFPAGLSYTFGQGFGTVKVNSSYLLIKDLLKKDVKNSSLVGLAGLEPATNRL